MYEGFMYTSGNAHGTGTSSTIKEVLDSWYESNLASHASYIDTDAGFCNDRTTYNGSGTGTTSTTYEVYQRIRYDKNPTLKCTSSSDLFTISSSSKGNQALSYPIGLITADEVVFAGGLNNDNSNKSYYLYTGQEYWTMSPTEYTNGLYSSSAAGFNECGGGLGQFYMGASLGVRPVINLKNVKVFAEGGTGTAENPYVVLTN